MVQYCLLYKHGGKMICQGLAYMNRKDIRFSGYRCVNQKIPGRGNSCQIWAIPDGYYGNLTVNMITSKGKLVDVITRDKEFNLTYLHILANPDVTYFLHPNGTLGKKLNWDRLRAGLRYKATQNRKKKKDEGSVPAPFGL